jgi:multiple sugar transport system ATP-binding protein
VLSARPSLREYEGKRVVLGIRPEDMEDASLLSEAPEDRRLPARVDLREALGSEIIVHFEVDAPIVLTEDVKELAVDVGAEQLEALEEQAREAKSVFVAQLNPRTQVREGDRIDLFVDTRRLHFFDPETGSGIYDRGTT